MSYLNTWPISAFPLLNLFNKKFGFAEIAEITVLDLVKNTLPCGKASMKNRCINKKIFAYRNEKFGGEMQIARLIPTIFSICIFIATTYNFHFRVLRDSTGGQHLCKHNVDLYIQTFIISLETQQIPTLWNSTSCSVGRVSSLWKSHSVSISLPY